VYKSGHARRTREDVDDVRREVQIMHHLKGHDNIVTLTCAYEDKQSIHLVGFCRQWPVSVTIFCVVCEVNVDSLL